MPRLAINYENTIIYKIVCKDVTIKECYVGHTTDFTNRKNTHKSNCNNSNAKKKYNLFIYQFIRENGDWDNWDMIEIEKYPCKNVNEATKQERLRMEELKATLNKYLPARTKQEWLVDNQEYMKLYHQEYYKDNVEHLQEYHQEYYKNNIEHIQEYYTKNREQILQKKAEKVTCICGSTCNKSSIRTHEKTLKHINFINSAVA